MAQSKMQTQEKVDYSDKNSDPAVGVSLCIPRVFNNIGYKRIKDMFIRMNWGYVERVDVIQLRGFKRAYVHFKPGEWNMRSREAMQVLEAMKRREEVTVTYDDPWFWKIGISRSPRPSEAPKPKPRPKVRLEREEEELLGYISRGRRQYRREHRQVHHLFHLKISPSCRIRRICTSEIY